MIPQSRSRTLPISHRAARQAQGPVLVTLNHVIAGVAYESVRISPYDVPINLEPVLKGLVGAIEDRFTELAGGTNIFVRKMDYKELYDLLDRALKSVPEYRRWNLTKWEMDQGYMDPEDDNRPVKFGFSSRHWPVDPPDNDFVDLDAHIRNATQLIWDLAVKEDEELRRGP
jgi:hypothetical protein